MKSVLISIRPQWCEKIANGTKTLEVRKTRPKLETPFKCYIYQTMRRENKGRTYSDGKVIGEFMCDYINKIYAPFGDKTGGTCLSAKEIYDYVNRDFCYGWHISELKIYDKPKKLGEFGLTRAPQSWCYVEGGEG